MGAESYLDSRGRFGDAETGLKGNAGCSGMKEFSKRFRVVNDVRETQVM